MLVFDRRRFRRGFSLVEILVAVLLIGILMAVAAPRLLGAREGAGDSAAQQQLSQVAAAAEISYLNSETFAGAKTKDALQDDVPDIQISTGATAGLVDGTSAREVAIKTTASDKTWMATALGGENRCWYIKVTYDPTVDPEQQGDSFAVVANATGNPLKCSVDNAPSAAADWNSFEFPAGE